MIILNLFIGVIMNSMSESQKESEDRSQLTGRLGPGWRAGPASWPTRTR